MQQFAALLYNLTLASSASDKRRLLTTYLKQANDPDRGYAVALLTGDIALPKHSPAFLRKIATDRMDTELFKLSHKFTSDLSETLSLLWPTTPAPEHIPTVTDIVTRLHGLTKKNLPSALSDLLDALPTDSRWAVLTLMKRKTGHGASSLLIKQALADLRPAALSIVEEAWHPPLPPYTHLFNWLEGGHKRPALDNPTRFRPMLRPHPYTPEMQINPETHSAERLYDGLPVQLVCADGHATLYTDDGDNISHALPENVDGLPLEAVFVASLIVHEPDGAHIPQEQLRALFASKSPLPKSWPDNTIHLIAHDLLSVSQVELRDTPFRERRKKLELSLKHSSPTLTPSQTLSFDDISSLDALRATKTERPHKGIHLKPWNTAYRSADQESAPIDWPCDPYSIEAVLLYANRSRKSQTYNELSFGVWGEDGTLLRIGKAHLKTTQDDQTALDTFIMENTVERFGPVRSVIATKESGITLKVAFEQLIPSKRHKAGYHLSNASVTGIEWNKPPEKACTLSALIELARTHTSQSCQ